ncbi:MAG: hypothetical protein JJT78_18665, partial [Leptospira sp.]|nr:hypothetical protein [Leptospira sp.]
QALQEIDLQKIQEQRISEAKTGYCIESECGKYDLEKPGFGEANALQVEKGNVYNDSSLKVKIRGVDNFKTYIDENGSRIVDNRESKVNLEVYLNNGTVLQVRPGSKVDLNNLIKKEQNRDRRGIIDRIIRIDRNEEKPLTPVCCGVDG